MKKVWGRGRGVDEMEGKKEDLKWERKGEMGNGVGLKRREREGGLGKGERDKGWLEKVRERGWLKWVSGWGELKRR